MAHEDETIGLCVADADVGRVASKGSGQCLGRAARQRACNMEINKSQRIGCRCPAKNNATTGIVAS